ncbi:efflux RND transporter periplasmic adaptor subunit [Ectobacillus funiculus]|uniref:Efflux RND transporter periplasmic adaptor subunit n=1 Tax=Ectobacillus funiculus TaxID=137993 RepID=A0ABV5WBK5_9BACI
MQTNAALAPKKRKKTWIVIGIITVIVVMAAINIAVMQSKKTGKAASLKFANIKERTLSSTKLVAGRVTPGGTETFYVDAAKGSVKDIFVNEGDEVAKGQKLFSYENPELDLQIKQAELQEKRTSLQYDQVKENVKSLNEDIQKAKDEGADATALNSQLKDLELQEKTTEIEKEQNQLEKQQLEKKQAELIVYSTINGRVQTLDKDAAQTSSAAVGQAKVFIQLASKDPYRVEGTLSELQKAQVQPEQAITVTSKAVANKTWTGKIIEVSDYPTTDATAEAAGGQGTQTISYYPFKAVLDTQDGLSPGYHVSLEIKLSANKMIAAPRSSIVEEGEEKFLYVVKAGKLQKQPVKTGMSDGEWIEITEGAEAGQKVLKNPSESQNVKDGMEVTSK